MRIGEVRDLGKIMGEKMSTTGEKGIYCHVCLLFRSHGYVSSRYDIQAVGYGRGRRAYKEGGLGEGRSWYVVRAEFENGNFGL